MNNDNHWEKLVAVEAERHARELREQWKQSCTEVQRHARDAFSSVRSIGEAYQFVKWKRSQQKNGVEAHVKEFEKLASILRGHDANCGVGHVRMGAKELKAEVQRVEQTAEEQRKELRTSQKEIQVQVAACVQGVHELQVQSVASLEDLPAEVKTRIQNRTLMRSTN